MNRSPAYWLVSAILWVVTAAVFWFTKANALWAVILFGIMAVGCFLVFLFLTFGKSSKK